MVKEIPVIWMAASACTGCSISLLNSESPTIENILIEPVVPGVHVNLRYHETLMAGAGEQALQVLLAAKDAPAVNADALEHAVAVKQPVVVDGDACLVLLEELAVDEDLQAQIRLLDW